MNNNFFKTCKDCPYLDYKRFNSLKSYTCSLDKNLIVSENSSPFECKIKDDNYESFVEPCQYIGEQTRKFTCNDCEFEDYGRTADSFDPDLIYYCTNPKHPRRENNELVNVGYCDVMDHIDKDCPREDINIKPMYYMRKRENNKTSNKDIETIMKEKDEYINELLKNINNLNNTIEEQKKIIEDYKDDLNRAEQNTLMQSIIDGTF